MSPSNNSANPANATPPGGDIPQIEITGIRPAAAAAQPVPIAPATQPGTAPSVHDPASSPVVGNLNSKEVIFYLKASATQLKAILQSAPSEVCSRIRSNASRETILEEILRLRNEEDFESRLQKRAASSAQGALRKFILMSSADLEHMADTDLPALQQLMALALSADSSLSPGQVPQSQQATLITALKWQLQAHRAADQDPVPETNNAFQVQEPAPQPPLAPAARVGSHTAPQAPTAHQPLNPTLDDLLVHADIQPPPAAGWEEGEDSDGDGFYTQRTPKRGVTVDNWVKGFRVGLNAGLEQILSTYPGNRPGANRLNVNQLRGPRILARIIVRGKDVEQHVSEFPFWRRTASGNPMQAEMEAHTLGRYMHMEILMHKSPLEALRHRPSLEIGLRRLYAILFVEQRMVQGETPDSRSAWMDIEFLLESTPNDAAPCDEIEDEMTRRLSQHKKRIAANRTIQDSENRKSKRHNRGSRSNNAQNNRRHNNTPANGAAQDSAN